MKNKKVFLLLMVSIFFIQCKKDRKYSNSRMLAEIQVRKQINNKVFLVEGTYFPDEYSEDCDFWLKIYKENKERYLYTFFNGSKIEKKGRLYFKDNDEGKQLMFDDEFKCMYSKDTILIQNYGNSMNYYERIPYCNFKFISLVKNFKIKEDNLIFYNDKAYYLEQSGLYKEAVYLLEKIIKKYPNRTVAYINLGDSYWGLGKKEEAKEAYKRYVEQMKVNGKEKKIPKRVLQKITE